MGACYTSAFQRFLATFQRRLLMDANKAIKNSLDMAQMVGMSYLGDLSDDELMKRPHPKCNHLNWQVGHLIASENQMMTQIAPEVMPALPEGFAEKYAKETATSDDPAQFSSKAELMATYESQRAGTLAALEKFTAEQLDEETGVDYAPTKGDMIAMQGSHWMMHCGQWVVVRRETEKPVLI